MAKVTRGVVLITGSSGLIGSALCDRLASTYDVVGFDREGPPHPPPTAEAIAVDLSSTTSVSQGLESVRHRHGGRLCAVIHLAAYYDFSGRPSPKYESVTVQGTRRLLRALQSFDVERFIFSSTMLIHAPGRPGQKISEKSSIKPTWAYPRSKVRTEQLIRTERGAIPAALLRIAGVYTDRGECLPVCNQIRRIYERLTTARFYSGDLRAGQSFVHLDDLLDAFQAAVDRRKDLAAETAILIGEPEAPGYGELQKELGRLIHGERWTTIRVPRAAAKIGARLPLVRDPFIRPWMIDRAGDHYDLDISKAQRVLGWNPRHRLMQTLPRIVEELKRDPWAWYELHRFTPPAWLPPPSSESRPSNREPAGAAR